MNRILIEQREVLTDFSVTLEGRRAKHILQVLKPETGQGLRIGIINGPKGEGTVLAQTTQAVTLSCAFETQIPPKPRIDLLLAMPRPRIMKRLWPQLAALGVGRILVTGAAKVEKYYFESRALLPEVIDPLLLDGLEQAGDTMLPAYEIHHKWHEAIDVVEREYSSSMNLVAAEQSTGVLREQWPLEQPHKVLLAIGSEGGWTLEELVALEALNFRAFSLGSRILRSDTACVAALAMVGAQQG